MCQHQGKINETKRRSLLKTSVSKSIEIAIDTYVIGLFAVISIPPLVTAITIECICFANHYFIDRLFNRIQWGREIK